LKPIRAFALAFSPNSQLLASAETVGKIQIWNLPRRRLVRTIVQSAGVWSLTFDTTGTQLAAGGHGLVEIWDVSAGDEIRKWPIKGTCLRLSFDQNNKSLAGQLRVCCTSGMLSVPNHSRGKRTLSWSPAWPSVPTVISWRQAE
jgi:WD40 repeat protein